MSTAQFVDGYISCALWTNEDDLDGAGRADLSESACLAISRDCEAFIKDYASIWREAGLSDSQAGHDFWLTRNRHGVGSWDRNIGEAGEQLTAGAHRADECYWYLGDDGLIYQAGAEVI